VNPWNLILATVVIFGAGVITGGLLVDHVNHAHNRAGHRPPPVVVVATNHPPVEKTVELPKPRPPEILSQQFVQHLDDLLQLTPAQHEAIQKIIAEGQEQNHVISTNCSAQYRQVLQDVRQHIREQLNPDQRKQFEEMLKQMHPAAHKPAGTNAVPVLPPATNDAVGRSTNMVGN
jgi:hypothetical protein